MKALKIYEINDGLDGIVVAKSLKQAIKKIVPFYHGYKLHEFIASIKKSDKDFAYDGDWVLTGLDKVAKKGRYRRPRILGWREW